MEEDGFVLVKSRHRKRRRIIASAQLNASTDDLSEVPVQKIDAVVDEAIRRLRSSAFCERVLSIMDSAVGKRHLSHIVAIGVGNFCERRLNGVDQIALLLILMEHFKCDARFREPLTTSNEKEWLISKSIRVEACNDLLDHLVEADETSICLCYMPHCGHALYNSVIYTHRAASDIERLILFGNDLQEMQIAKAYASELDAVCEYRKCCETIRLPTFADAPCAFNDTAVHFLTPSSIIPKIPDHLPHYEFYAPEIMLKGSKL